MLSETGKWLERALLTLSLEEDSVLQLDSETLHSLVSCCERAPPTDAEQYLLVTFFHISIVPGNPISQMDDFQIASITTVWSRMAF
jgi:hypothetical protein